MRIAGPRCPIPNESDSPFASRPTPQFTKIVNLAIEGQHIAVVVIHHRLMAASSEIDDAEAIVPERNIGIFSDISSRIVRAAVADASACAEAQPPHTGENRQEASRQSRT